MVIACIQTKSNRWCFLKVIQKFRNFALTYTHHERHLQSNGKGSKKLNVVFDISSPVWEIVCGTRGFNVQCYKAQYSEVLGGDESAISVFLNFCKALIWFITTSCGLSCNPLVLTIMHCASSVLMNNMIQKVRIADIYNSYASVMSDASHSSIFGPLFTFIIIVSIPRTFWISLLILALISKIKK